MPGNDFFDHAGALLRLKEYRGLISTYNMVYEAACIFKPPFSVLQE